MLDIKYSSLQKPVETYFLNYLFNSSSLVMLMDKLTVQKGSGLGVLFTAF